MNAQDKEPKRLFVCWQKITVNLNITCEIDGLATVFKIMGEEEDILRISILLFTHFHDESKYIVG